jgi:glycerophosphoryl diester phosphodiesterase
VNYVDGQLENRDWAGIYDDCYKIWATRGLVLEGFTISPASSQNSIKSIQLAFDRGARGTEVDVQFDTDTGQFIVSHDVPYNLKDGRLLTLEELFDKTGGRGYYWIDFKKIRKLGRGQLKASVNELERLANKFQIKKWIYVEGESPFSLAPFRDAGFQTIYDIHPPANNNLFTPTIIEAYKLVFYFGNFSVIAMKYGPLKDSRYGAHAKDLLGNIPLFVYHIGNDIDAISRLSEISAVRVIILADHSVDLYRLSACQAPQQEQ